MSRVDHYAVLGVPLDASQATIKQAYRRLALECHPDRFPDDEEAARRFRQVSEAYGVLSSPSKRAHYDRSLRFPEGIDLAHPMTLPTARDLFRNVFGDVFGQRKRERRSGRDIRYTLTVDLRDAVLGSQHTIRFEANGPCDSCSGTGARKGGKGPQTCSICEGRGEIKGRGLLAQRTRCGRCDGTGMVQPDPCPTCRGRGSVRQPREFRVAIPPGTEAGAERIVRAQGEPGRYGGGPGHLRVTVNVRTHPTLRRVGHDLSCDAAISLTQAALGGRVSVPTIEGEATVTIPAGVQSGTRMRLEGRGVPRNAGERGDQLVRILVETPTRLSEEARIALERLESTMNSEMLPERQRTRTESLEDEDPDASD